MMKRYLPVFLHHKNLLALMFLLGVAASLMAIVTTYVAGMFINIVIEATAVSQIVEISLSLLGISLVTLLMGYIATRLSAPMNERIVFNIKQSIMFHLIAKPDVAQSHNSTYLSKRIDEDSRQLTQFVLGNYATIVIKTVELFVIGWLVFRINTQVAVAMLLVCPLYFMLYRFFKKTIFDKTLALRESSAIFFRDYTQGVEQAQREEGASAEVSESFELYHQNYRRYTAVNANLNITQGLLIGLVQTSVFLIGGISVLNGHTNIGLLSIMMVYFNQILGNIRYYLELGKKYQMTKASVQRLDELVSEKEAVLST